MAIAEGSAPGAPTTRPGHHSESAGTTVPQEMARALPGLRGAWRPVLASPSYVLGLVIMFALTLLMPLMYLGFIGGIVYGGYRFSLMMPGVFASLGSGPGGRGGVLALILAVTLIGAVYVSLLVILLALLRPLLVWGGRDERLIRLEPGDDPKLFEFVYSVCAVIGAPRPQEIEVDCSINAAAAIRGGLLGMFIPNNVVLHIGMPLAAGMTVEQFASVLVHEFGHFSQRAAMRLVMGVNAIQGWFYHASNMRGTLDFMIEDLAQRANHWLIQLAIVIVRLSLGLSRLLLWLIYLSSMVFVFWMLRRQEFNSDKHAARFVGSERALESMKKLMSLTMAEGPADVAARDMWKVNKLPQNFAALIAHTAHKRRSMDQASVEALLKDTSSGVFSSHPSPASRMKYMTALKEEGIFRDARPASEVFSDFEGVCRKATYGHFRALLGRRVFDATFVPVAGSLSPEALRPWIGSVAPGGDPTGTMTAGGLVVVASAGEGSAPAGIEAFLGFEPPPWRPMLITTMRAPDDDPRVTVSKWKEYKAAAAAATPGAAAVCGQYAAESGRAYALEAASTLIGSNMITQARHPLLKERSAGQVRAALEPMRAARADQAAALDDAMEAHAGRIGRAMSLLQTPQVAAKLKNAPKLVARAKELVAANANLAAMLPALRDLKARTEEVGLVIAALESKAADPKVATKRLMKQIEEIAEIIGRVKNAGASAVWPFSTSDVANEHHSLTVGLLLAPGMIPRTDDPGPVYDMAVSTLARYESEYQTPMLELARIAHTVEALFRKKTGESA